jgi:hypothetical protein
MGRRGRDERLKERSTAWWSGRWVRLACVFSTAVLAGCAHVAPYQRAQLARPMMTRDLDGPAAAHVLAVHEGATGGGAISESGCGCN